MQSSCPHGAGAASRSRLTNSPPYTGLVNVLGIESSCDETGVALVATSADGPPRLLAEALHSQAEMHAAYGGVVPELASRDHIRRVLPLARQVLDSAGCTLQQVDLVAYTRGPGLAGALLVGAGVAVALAAALGKPALGVHHLEGHLLSPFLGDDAAAVSLRGPAGLRRPHATDARARRRRLRAPGRNHRRCRRRGLRQERQAARPGLPGRPGAGAHGGLRRPRGLRAAAAAVAQRGPGLFLRRAQDRGDDPGAQAGPQHLRAVARRSGGIDAGRDRRRAGGQVAACAVGQWHAAPGGGRRRRRQPEPAREARRRCGAPRRQRALPAARAVHRQRRDDRAGRRAAPAARPGRRARRTARSTCSRAGRWTRSRAPRPDRAFS